jgi:hypothetical protein
VLNTLALLLLSPVMLLSLRKLIVSFHERSDPAAQSAVRWATIALGLSLCVALAELAFVYVERVQSEPRTHALWEGLRAAKNLCAPPIGVSGAMLYLARLFRTAARAARH